MSPADAGDDDFQSSGGGARLDNDVFFFRWLPKVPPDDSIAPTDYADLSRRRSPVRVRLGVLANRPPP
jgi:hypothetical protein